MTLSRPVNDFAFIEQETIILGARNVLLRAAGSPMSLVGEWGALQKFWFKLFDLLFSITLRVGVIYFPQISQVITDKRISVNQCNPWEVNILLASQRSQLSMIIP